MNAPLATSPDDAVVAEFRANSGSVTQAMGGALAGLQLVLLHHRGRHMQPDDRGAGREALRREFGER